MSDNNEVSILSVDDGIMTLASNGTIVNDFRTGYRVQISWTVNSQNIANNTSNVTVKVQLVSTGRYYTINASATKNGSVTINGSTYSFTFSAALSANQTKTVYTKTLDISHNNDGTKTLSLSASLGIKVTLSGTYWGTVTASGSGVLNTIPRTSSISLSASSVNFGSAITVNISRATTAFTHKVYYSFGSKTVTVATAATTSASYTIPLDHMTEIPNSTSGSAIFYVDTYSGSTYIGTASAAFTIYVPSNIVPSLSSLSASIVAAGAATSLGYVKGKSKCTLVINGASGTYGSSIRSYSISGGGYSSTSNSFTTGVLNSAGTVTFTATVTDSRGRTSAAKTVSITVNDYAPPTLEYLTVIRCLSSGQRDDDNGTYISVSFEYTSATVVMDKVTNKIEYKATNSSTWINAGSINSPRGIIFGGGNISTSTSYDVRITLSDTISTVTQTYTIPTAYAIIDIKKGGKGIAIGKSAETDNLFDVEMNTRLNGSVTVSNTSKSNLVGGSSLAGVTKVSNFNDIWKSGFYDGSTDDGLINCPYSGWNWLLHIGHSNNRSGYNYGMQLAAQNGTTNFAIRTVNAAGTGSWNNIYHTGNKPSTNDIGALKAKYVSGYLGISAPNGDDSGWVRTTNSGLLPYTSGGYGSIGTSSWRFNEGWFNQINCNWHSYFGDGINVTGWSVFNPSASSGVQMEVSNGYTGNSGTEPTINPVSSGGWGTVGTDARPLMKGYAYQWVTKSDRNLKYNITKLDTETMYNNIQNINIYGYRHISTRDNDENIKRQNLQIGCMVDELPLEVVDYDNEDGKGKAIDLYSYITMVLGATKHLQQKVEILEKENEDLKTRLDRMEEVLNGIINGG